MIRTALLAALLAAALAGAAQAQEASVTRRATQVRETPADGGRSLVWLPAHAPVTRGTQREGPWIQVRTADGTSGWVRMFDIEPAAAETASASVGGALRGVTNLVGGNRPVQPRSVAAGIRGLGAEDIARAHPNPGAVAQMERLRLTEADARAFAESAALQPVVIAPLAAPAADPAGAAPAVQPRTADPSQPQSP